VCVRRTGRVITLETVTVPLFGSSGKPDSGITRWLERVIDDIPTVFFFRLFYVSDAGSSVTGRPVGELGTRFCVINLLLLIIPGIFKIITLFQTYVDQPLSRVSFHTGAESSDDVHDA